MPPSTMTSQDITRFWSKVNKDIPSGCWEWMGCVNGWGYGIININGKTWRTHRISWMLAHGEWPNLFVCHKCDNPKCVNPDHLFLGTHNDNMRDMVSKDRHFKGVPVCGEHHPLHKLTDRTAIEIREKYASGKYTQRELAKQYGVSQRGVWRVIHHQSWNYINQLTEATQ
jgi:hypothetical protein